MGGSLRRPQKPCQTALGVLPRLNVPKARWRFSVPTAFSQGLSRALMVFALSLLVRRVWRHSVGQPHLLSVHRHWMIYRSHVIPSKLPMHTDLYNAYFIFGRCLFIFVVPSSLTDGGMCHSVSSGMSSLGWLFAQLLLDSWQERHTDIKHLKCMSCATRH